MLAPLTPYKRRGVMNFSFEGIITWFETTALYREVISRLPAPLNNSVFSGIVIIVLIVFVIISLIDRIKEAKIRRRIKKKNRQYEEKKLDEALRQSEEVSQNRAMEKYLQFMMMVQMQNAMSLQGMSYDQWKKEVYENEHFKPFFDGDNMPNIDTIAEFLNKTEQENKQSGYGPFVVPGFENTEKGGKDA